MNNSELIRSITATLIQLADYNEQIIVDEVSTTVTYIGTAEFGVSAADAKWKIRKITAASGSTPQGVITTTHRTGYMDKTNVWNDRATGTYYS